MKDNNEMLDAFVEGAQAGQIKAKGFGKTQIQAQMLLEMLTIDGERASDNDEGLGDLCADSIWPSTRHSFSHLRGVHPV